MTVTKKREAPTQGAWPDFGQEEIEAVTRVLTSGRVNYWSGQEGRSFEKEYAEYVGSRHAVALANGTVTLELALHCLGVGAGDEVVVTPRTFIATASAAAVRGAVPVMADVDADSGNITAETVERVLTPRTRAVICVHIAGWPCEMDALMELCRSRDIALIEDCAQAHGATYRGRQVGSFGDFGSFSFCTDKILSTAGEGGMLTTDSEELWSAAWSYKDHGKSYDTVYHKEHPPGFRWLHESWGTNWRLTEMQSAVGRVILGKLPEWLKARRRRAEILEEYLSQSPALRLPPRPSHLEHAFYKHYAYVRPEALKSGWDRDRILADMSELGLPSYSGTCSEIYLEKAFPQEMRPKERLPVARELGETSLMFQVHPTLSEDWMRYLGDAVLGIMRKAQR